ncbi:MAG: hypothetical protein AUJ28_02210 [Parcubacteria group bacterium CG1_02_37_51]|uniref:Proline--tRNA ligase n=2 Tax=Candidatus Komeiliibacteriota TaxID=1817908 RepID=A0A2M8DRB1_9BACT|nr:MAG: hypothetical protein AUJ28_02210 [Parcubacteria group bacterium CG1_02_37_51]PIY95338.1 MAG: hypothetical protein COY67_00585 [Candidatus Komeilibacteria bacterium CG_4_10_14_0_8_um_filter_37_78]PJC01929.1 MAG: hypothetical protein CO073_02105 [Candidatus Komeilibacteria bacterium CG_4_9_14_0_8_um_filter_36_9]
MRQSEYFIKTLKEAPTDETSINAQLLIRAGYIDKLLAGAYTYLPLGVRVLDKIKQIVREEMNNIGAHEILMPALQPKNIWEETDRWQQMKDIMFQFKGRGGIDIGLGTTHEEPIVDMLRKRVNSYRDLPVYLYQIQDKFRNEPRAKSGLLRGREFSMKDLYSFHQTEQDLKDYYEVVKQSYVKIFQKLDMEVLIVEASGGVFSKEYSHEFQVLTPNGEDTIYYCQCGWAQNKEIVKLKVGDDCPNCNQASIQESKAIEVGNIFKLGQKYAKAMNLSYLDDHGKKQYVYMGCYGFGPSRVMGSIVELFNDANGIIWPAAVSPWSAHLLLLGNDQETRAKADKLYAELQANNIDVLYDDRDESPGLKLKEADLIGITKRLIVSDKNKDLIEYKLRQEEEISKHAIKDIIKLFDV